MKPNDCYQYQTDGNQWAGKNCTCASFSHKYNKIKQFQEIDASKAAKALAERTVLLCRASWGNQSCLCTANARVYQVQVLIILSWRWSQCHTSTMCVMKTLCLESTLHTMLSSPIRACIRNNRWTAGILSILQLTGSNHVAGVVIWCRKTQVSDGWTRKAGREWHQSQHLSSEHSDLSCLIFQPRLSVTPASSLAWHILQQRFLVLNSATSSLLVSSFHPDFDSLHCQSLRMFQAVVEKVLTLMPPATKSASLGFITWQVKIDKLTTYHEVASWKACTMHSLAGYMHQTVKRHRVVARAHLDFTSSE